MARSIASASTLLATASLFCVGGTLGCGDNRASLTHSTASDADPALGLSVGQRADRSDDAHR